MMMMICTTADTQVMYYNCAITLWNTCQIHLSQLIQWWSPRGQNLGLESWDSSRTKILVLILYIKILSWSWKKFVVLIEKSCYMSWLLLRIAYLLKNMHFEGIRTDWQVTLEFWWVNFFPLIYLHSSFVSQCFENCDSRWHSMFLSTEMANILLVAMHSCRHSGRDVRGCSI